MFKILCYHHKLNALILLLYVHLKRPDLTCVKERVLHVFISNFFQKFFLTTVETASHLSMSTMSAYHEHLCLRQSIINQILQ